MWWQKNKKTDVEPAAQIPAGLESADIAKIFAEIHKTQRLKLWRPVVIICSLILAVRELLGQYVG